MPQSLDCILLHLIFSTRERYPYVTPAIRPDLYSYLAAAIRNHGCECPLIGGVADHVHIAVRLARTLSVATLVEQIKITSSKWLKTQGDDLRHFAWQRGYAVFSVGPADQEKLLEYIRNQEEHHRKQSFQDEYRAFLTKYGVAYDEQYVWD